jgi:hypothetical protein
MDNLPARIPAMALTFVLLAAPAAAFAQVPTREGNVWNWRDHQPTEMQVEHNEKVAGIAQTPSERESASATVEQLYRQLLQSSRG